MNTYEFKTYNWIDNDAVSAVGDLIQTQKLSGFLGQAGDEFLGGPWVLDFEKLIAKQSKSQYAITFNSWTSGLEAAFIALEIEEGSEVIVTPWTMSATVAAICGAGLVPIFCDIDENTFNIDERLVETMIGPKTRAICSVDLFGRPCNAVVLRQIADAFDLKLVIDSAQCPTGTISGRAPSEIADIGGFSYNRHKHVQTGEGGAAITNSDELYRRLVGIRNHGENNPEFSFSKRANFYGHNWRLGEIESLLGVFQYRKISEHIDHRRIAASKIKEGLNLPGLLVEDTPSNIQHDYYILGFRIPGIRKRDIIVERLKELGISFVVSRYPTLHRLKAFSNYRNGILPVAERLHDEEFIGLYMCGHWFDDRAVSFVIDSFNKVWSELNV